MIENNRITKKQFLHAAGLAVMWITVTSILSCGSETGGTMAKNAAPGCATCPMRARYDGNPRSLIGRFWKWHIKWCPGWKAYLASLPEDERKKTVERYK